MRWQVSRDARPLLQAAYLPGCRSPPNRIEKMSCDAELLKPLAQMKNELCAQIPVLKPPDARHDSWIQLDGAGKRDRLH